MQVLNAVTANAAFPNTNSLTVQITGHNHFPYCHTQTLYKYLQEHWSDQIPFKH